MLDDWTDSDLDDLLGSCLVTGQLVQLLDIPFSGAKQYLPLNASEAQARSHLVEYCLAQRKVDDLLARVKECNEKAYNEMTGKRAIAANLRLSLNGPSALTTENADLFDRLTKINFWREVVFFHELIKHEPRAALWIRESDVTARQVLLYRLVNDLDEGQVNTGKARRKKARADYSSSYADAYTIWRETGKEVGIVFDDDQTENSKTKILDGICKCLKTQDFIIVLRNIEYALDDDEIKASIVSFWQSLVQAGRDAAHPSRLLLFLVEERKANISPSDLVKLNSVTWTDWGKGHDCAMPLRLNVIEKFTQETIMIWYGSDAPHLIKTGIVGWQKLWKDADEGQPHKIYSAACKCCNEHPSNFETWLKGL